MPEVQIPESAAGITGEWLAQALGEEIWRNSGVQLTRTRVADSGVFGDVILVSLSGSCASESIIVKLSTERDQDRHHGQRYRVYEREVIFYLRLSGDVGIDVPRCYFARYDPTTGKSCLILEDLSLLKRYDQISGCNNVQRGRRLVETLASLHGTWWDERGKLPLIWIPSLSDQELLEVREESYAKAWWSLQNKRQELMDPSTKVVGDTIQRNLKKLLRELSVPPCTLLHGDYRLDNVFFDDRVEPTRCVVFDWQLVAQGRGGADLAYLLCQSFDERIRRESEGELMSLYLQKLARVACVDYPSDALWRDYRLGLLFGFTYAVHAAGAFEIKSERWEKLASTIMRRSMAAISETHALQALE